MKTNLHNHTKCSNGVLTVSELASLKRKEGFDLIAVTDHDSIFISCTPKQFIGNRRQ